jgi:hypothetical protein
MSIALVAKTLRKASSLGDIIVAADGNPVHHLSD